MLLFFISSIRAYSIIDQLNIAPSDNVCCFFSEPILNFEVILNKEHQSSVVSISPDYEYAAILFQYLNSHGILAQISRQTTKYVIKGTTNTTTIKQYHGLDFLKEVYIQKYIVSEKNCSDATNVCKNSNNFLHFVVIFGIIASYMYFNVRRIKIVPYFNLFDKNIRPIHESVRKLSKEELKCQHDSLTAVHISGVSQVQTVSVERDYPRSKFHKSISYALKDGNYITFFWTEKISDIDDLNLKVEFSSENLTATNISYQMLSYRHYRPLVMTIELSNNSRIKLEIPLNVLLPFLSQGCSSTLLFSSLIQCNRIIMGNKFLPSDFIQLMHNYSISMGLLRSLVLESDGSVICQYSKAPLTDLTPEQIAKVQGMLRKEDEYIDYDLLPDCYATLVRYGETDVVLIGITKSQVPMAQSTLSLILLTALFVRKITIARDKLTKYERLVDLMEASGRLMYFEYNVDLQKIILSKPNNVKYCHEGVIRACHQFLETQQKNFIFQWKEKTYIILADKIPSKNNEQIIGLLAENITWLLNEKKEEIKRYNEVAEAMQKIGAHRLIMKPRPHLDDDDNLISQLGYPIGTSLLSIIHPDDAETFCNLGSSIKPSVPVNDDYNKTVLTFLHDIEPLDRYLIMAPTEREYYREHPNRIYIPDVKVSETACIRVLSANNRVHFFSVSANSEIGFMHSLESAFEIMIDTLGSFPFTTARVNSTFWGVDIGSDSIFPLYGLPTIWDVLGVDQMTPFSNVANFIQGDSRPLFVNGLMGLRVKGEKSWTGTILLSMVGGKSFWYKLSMFVQDTSLYCVMTQIDDIKNSVDKMKSYLEEITPYMNIAGIKLWSFIDIDEVMEDKNLPLSDFSRVLSWANVDIVAKEYRDAFMRNMRSTFEFGHYFEMYLPVDIDGTGYKWCAMLGKRGEKGRVIFGIWEPTDVLRKNLKPAGEAEIAKLGEIASGIIEKLKSRYDLTPAQLEAIIEAENALRLYKEQTASGGDLPTDAIM